MGRLLDAARSGDERLMLEALRDEVATTIEEGSSPRDMAALSKRLVEVCDRLKAIPRAEDMNPIDAMAELVAEYDDYEDPRTDDEDAD
jgi:hypothetical protein